MRRAEDCPAQATPDDYVPVRCAERWGREGGPEPKEAAVFLHVSIHVCAFAVCGEAVGSAEAVFNAKNDNDMVSVGVSALTGIQCQRGAAVCVFRGRENLA